MSLAVSGQQFVENGTTETYTVTGIPSGYTLDSVVLPNGWAVDSTGAIGGGSQAFDFDVAIGSGTIIITYIKAGVRISCYLDVYSDATRMGEEITEDGAILLPPPNSTGPLFCDTTPCKFTLNVFADPDDPTNFKNNDKSEFYFPGDASVAAIAMTLQQFLNGSWQDIETITDDSYGSFFEFGKHPDFSGADFTDDFNKKYTGVFLDWFKVYDELGVGRYRMKITYTDIFDEDTVYYSNSEYCLKRWNCHNSEGTVKIQTLNQGLRGTLDNPTLQIDYSTGWYGEIRLKGILRAENPSYQKEFNQYGDPKYNALKPIVNEQTPKFKLQIKPVPGWIDRYIQTNMLQADQTLITDFNSRNRHSFVQLPVINDGDFTVVNEEYKNPLAVLEIKLSYGQNNLRKRNSG